METVLWILALVSAVVPHEYAHGWVAGKFGDPTARMKGRLTLNPIKHIDPVGTILVPVILYFLPVNFIFGWAKPVPVNFSLLRNPKRDMIWVAAAGPGINFCIAGVAAVLMPWAAGDVQFFLMLVVLVNVFLALFNLIPIPPLDGSRILMGLLPVGMARAVSRIEPFGIIILIVLLNFGFLRFILYIGLFLALLLGVTPEMIRGLGI